MFILSSEQISMADAATIRNNGIASIDLMEHAATLCFQWLHQRLQGKPTQIHVFCGIGNNGGDGLVMVRHLIAHGYSVSSYVVNFSDKRTEDFLSNYNRLKEIGHWPKVIHGKNDFPSISEKDIVIDAIFGNGLSRTPDGFTKELFKTINDSKAFTLAIDSPSGLFSDTNVTDKDAVIIANHILTFESPKLAFLLPDNRQFVNTWEVLDIGLDKNFIQNLNTLNHFTTPDDARLFYKPRKKWSHKGSFGHTLIIGGSFGKIGAVSLCTQGALRIGSGLVSAFVPKCGYEILQTAIPEAMVEVDSDTMLTYFNYKTTANIIAVGPGMGIAERTVKGFTEFLKNNEIPLVIDADALNCISLNPETLEYIPANSVLTPHPKELERLIGPWKHDYEKIEKAKKFALKHKLILVLKDAHTIITDGIQLFFNSSGNPALATGGSGDVLTGMIAGLIAQGYKPLEAAIFGVYIHGLTADIAVPYTGHESFTATDIIENIGQAILYLFDNDQEQKEKSNSEKNSENN